MPRRKLTRKQIGEGFFSSMFKKGVSVFKKHAKKHVSAAISHGKKVAKAAAAEAKQQAIAYAKQQLEEKKAQAKAAIHAKISEVKQAAVKKVRSHVCSGPEVGAGFFDDIAAQMKAHAEKEFNSLRKKAVSHVKGAKSAAEQQLHAHKDKAIAKVHAKVTSVKKKALSKARKVAGCGSGLQLKGAGVRKKKYY